MKIVDISTEFYKEIGEPADSSISFIAYWVRSNYGQLNAAINTRFYLDDTLELVRICGDTVIEIGPEEKDVLKGIFNVYYVDSQIRKNMLSYTTSPVVEVQQDGNLVRIASSTEIGKNLAMYRKQYTDDLKTLITAYKLNKSTPRQVAGDDDTGGIDNTQFPVHVVNYRRL